MGKYLKEFDNEAAYEAAKNGLELPNVSLCISENEVHYEPYPFINGHEYVDLGLPSGTKWATMNVGANSITDYGNYYQYGKGDKDYMATRYDGAYKGMENPLAASADTATQVWGSAWHVPTSAQCAELTANTTFTWETNFNGSNINGGKFTAQNGKYIFLPAVGYYMSSGVQSIGTLGRYTTSTPKDTSYASVMDMSKSGSLSISYNGRSLGMGVRPVAN